VRGQTLIHIYCWHCFAPSLGRQPDWLLSSIDRHTLVIQTRRSNYILGWWWCTAVFGVAIKRETFESCMHARPQTTWNTFHGVSSSSSAQGSGLTPSRYTLSSQTRNVRPGRHRQVSHQDLKLFQHSRANWQRCFPNPLQAHHLTPCGLLRHHQLTTVLWRPHCLLGAKWDFRTCSRCLLLDS